MYLIEAWYAKLWIVKKYPVAALRPLCKTKSRELHKLYNKKTSDAQLSSSTGHASVRAFCFCPAQLARRGFDPGETVSKLRGEMVVTSSIGLESWKEVFNKRGESANG